MTRKLNRILAACLLPGLMFTTTVGFVGLTNGATLQAQAKDVDTTCGENLAWAFETSTGTLTISGTGDITKAPWKNLKNEIKVIEVEEGVTSICEEAFANCSNLETVVIPSTMEKIGKKAFFKCGAVKDVYCYAVAEDLTWVNPNQDFSVKTLFHVSEDAVDEYKDTFSSAKVIFTGDLAPIDDPDDTLIKTELGGCSLSLGGDIAVYFYVDVSEAELSENAYMEFTVPVGDKKEIRTMSASDATSVDVGNTSYSVFKCTISAKDAFSEVTAQIIDGERASVTYASSVVEYADYIIEHQDESEAYAKAAPLVEALMSYCACAQKYFGVTSEHESASYINTDAIDGVTKESIPANGVIESLEDLGDVTFEGATLSLKSKTSLSLYFTSADELSFSCDGMLVEKAESGEYQIARIRGISALDLDKTYTLTVTKGSGDEAVSGTIEYSAMDYCYTLLDKGEDEGMKDVVRALYLFYDAACEYEK